MAGVFLFSQNKDPFIVFTNIIKRINFLTYYSLSFKYKNLPLRHIFKKFLNQLHKRNE